MIRATTFSHKGQTDRHNSTESGSPESRFNSNHEKKCRSLLGINCSQGEPTKVPRMTWCDRFSLSYLSGSMFQFHMILLILHTVGTAALQFLKSLFMVSFFVVSTFAPRCHPSLLPKILLSMLFRPPLHRNNTGRRPRLRDQFGLHMFRPTRNSTHSTMQCMQRKRCLQCQIA